MKYVCKGQYTKITMDASYSAKYMRQFWYPKMCTKFQILKSRAAMKYIMFCDTRLRISLNYTVEVSDWM